MQTLYMSWNGLGWTVAPHFKPQQFNLDERIKEARLIGPYVSANQNCCFKITFNTLITISGPDQERRHRREDIVRLATHLGPQALGGGRRDAPDP